MSIELLKSGVFIEDLSDLLLCPSSSLILIPSRQLPFAKGEPVVDCFAGGLGGFVSILGVDGIIEDCLMK